MGTADGRVVVTRDQGVTWNDTRLLFSALPLAAAYRRTYTEPLSYQGVRNISGGPSPAQVLAFSPIQGFRNSHELDVNYRITSALNGWLVRPLEAFPEANPQIAHIRRPKSDDLRIIALDIEPYNADVAWAGGSFGVWRTRDRGLSWRPVHQNPGQVRGFARHPRSPARLFVFSDQGITYSDDQGDSWTKMNVPAFANGVWALTFHPETATILTSTDSATYQSNDGGSTFYKIANQRFERLAIDLLGNTFGIARGTLYRRDARDFNASDDSFAAVSLPFEGRVAQIALTEEGPMGVFVATDRDLFASADHGVTWQVVQTGDLSTEVQGLAPATARTRGLVLTRRDVYGFHDPRGTIRGGALERFQQKGEAEPSLTDVIRAALKRQGLDNLVNQTERAELASILPKISTNFSYRTYDLNGEDHPTWLRGDARGHNDAHFEWFQFYLTASWKLSEIAYSKNASPNSSLMKRARNEALALTQTLSSAYEERQALRFAAFLGDGDTRAQIWRDLRIEALEAKIECLSGLSLKSTAKGDL